MTITLEPGNIRVRKREVPAGTMESRVLSPRRARISSRESGLVSERSRKNWDLADYVLSSCKGEERKLMDEGIEHAADALEMIRG